MRKRLNSIANLFERILDHGIFVGETIELVGPTLELMFGPNSPVSAFERNIRAACEKASLDIGAKMLIETNQYLMFEYGILHSQVEAQWFHGQDWSSRKIIMTHTDCISCVQAMQRGTIMHVLVYIRSSDAYGLLLSDLLGLLSAAESWGNGTAEGIQLKIMFGSLHVYDKDRDKLRSLIAALRAQADGSIA